MISSKEIRKRFLDFFAKRGHIVLPSASLIPENDPTVLFNTAGMQPLAPYLMGNPHPEGDKLVDIQKCLRTTDIDDVGDNTHNTFFEMMGNWSLGSYFKEEAIKWSYEFLTSKDEGLGLDPNRLYITVFEGDENAPKDEEAKKAWIEAGIPENRIYFKGADSNWWPAVKGKDAWTGPTGPCSEMFYDITKEGLGDLTKEKYIKADEEQRVVEIWNDVFMEYEKKDGKIVGKLKQKNVDTGAGFERLCTVVQGKESIFDTDIFEPIIKLIRENSKIQDIRAERIVADHIRASVMLISDGATPSNTDQGYVLRRLIRRAMGYAWDLGVKKESISFLIDPIIDFYKDFYHDLEDKEDHIKKIITEEESKFIKTIKSGQKTLVGLVAEAMSSDNPRSITGKDLFDLYASSGYPVEMSFDTIKNIILPELGIQNLGKDLFDEENIRIEFQKLFEEHQEKSRLGSEQKFKGGLGDTSEMSVKYHTATHLLHQALRDVLGDKVEQKGSNITPERLRFDFSFDRKMTDEEKKRVEEIVNKKIEEELSVNRIEMNKEEALKTGALHFFKDKYGDNVSIYFIGENLDNAYSKEFCGGPHVSNTKELGKFEITKEEAVSLGVRRIKAVLK